LRNKSTQDKLNFEISSLKEKQINFEKNPVIKEVLDTIKEEISHQFVLGEASYLDIKRKPEEKRFDSS
jgi:hypothetical protein